VSFQPEIPEREYRPVHPEPAWRTLARKIWAPIVVVGGLLVKFGFAFAKFASIFIAVGGYALLWGWQIGIGFVVLLLVHELGHFVEARRRGFNASWPVFIPFFGAYVSIKNALMNPWQSFWIAAAGPISGGVGAAAIWVVGEQRGVLWLQALGYIGFFLNLVNLIPAHLGIVNLDGATMMDAIKTMRLGGTPRKAWTASVVYGALVLLLVVGMFGSHVTQHRL
jgi:Zn-dependent protease